ncbi:MAG: hypothetical protein HOO06_00040 [Bdellovibrionaceae bacterium]|jgi:hypothetical protein|nr:hypothetical protein [Pseudobdellovibrionaceae bacterium]
MKLFLLNLISLVFTANLWAGDVLNPKQIETREWVSQKYEFWNENRQGSEVDPGEQRVAVKLKYMEKYFGCPESVSKKPLILLQEIEEPFLVPSPGVTIRRVLVEVSYGPSGMVPCDNKWVQSEAESDWLEIDESTYLEILVPKGYRLFVKKL